MLTSLTANGTITIQSGFDRLTWDKGATEEVNLFLANEPHKNRMIGHIIKYPDYLIYQKKVNPKKHYHYKTNSFGINAVVVNKWLDDSDYIAITTFKTNGKKAKLSASGYYINVGTLKETGEYYNFNKTSGCEAQLFSDLKNWEIFEEVNENLK